MNKKNVHAEREVGKGWISESPLLVSLEYVANLFSLSERTVRRLSQSGKLPPIIKVGHLSRMKLQDVFACIDKMGGFAI